MPAAVDRYPVAPECIEPIEQYIAEQLPQPRGDVLLRGFDGELDVDQRATDNQVSYAVSDRHFRRNDHSVPQREQAWAAAVQVGSPTLVQRVEDPGIDFEFLFLHHSGGKQRGAGGVPRAVQVSSAVA